MKALILLCLVLNGCTIASYKDGDFFIADLHPGGESVVIQGTLAGKGELKVERTNEDSTQVLEAALEAAAKRL